MVDPVHHGIPLINRQARINHVTRHTNPTKGTNSAHADDTGPCYLTGAALIGGCYDGPSPAGRGPEPRRRGRARRPGGCGPGGRGSRGCWPRDEGHLAAQVTGDMLGEVDERGAQRAGQGGDHLAGGFLAAALDLGQVLRRDPGPGRRLGQRFLLFLAEDPEPPAEHFPPEGLLGSRFRLRFRGSRWGSRRSGYTFACSAIPQPKTALAPHPRRFATGRPSRNSVVVAFYRIDAVERHVH